MTSFRRRSGIALSAVMLAGLGVAAPAGADRPAEPQDDLITGQDHPADVTVFAWQYLPSTVKIKQGQKIKFGNYDMYPYGAGLAAHSMEEAIPGCTSPPYHTDKGCDRYPLFSSALTDHGFVHNVAGVDKLPKGTYPFTCQIHSQMSGTLVVE